jgi:predicted  nucleic acid-binding Zn-ribbon protein
MTTRTEEIVLQLAELVEKIQDLQKLLKRVDVPLTDEDRDAITDAIARAKSQKARLEDELRRLTPP